MTPETAKTVLLFVTAALALVSAYHQFIRFRGAKLVALERPGAEPQTATTMKYSDLPPEIRNQYPDYKDPRGCNALVRVPFANEGDRAGYVKILSVRLPDGALQGPEAKARVRSSFYTYCVVPAFGIGLHLILLRNLPVLDVDTKIKLEIDMELVRVHPLTRRHNVKRMKNYEIEVLLKAPNPELIQPT